ncbi:UNVERIFIED_CONTAM: hypothetical protein PYX00_003450 [Menopon gallinae]|uniref:Secreted protein n=1 Tax=Menopon gallinae TaxID=328185 RepID=A0AAW2I154_9NEOP
MVAVAVDGTRRVRTALIVLYLHLVLLLPQLIPREIIVLPVVGPRQQRLPPLKAISDFQYAQSAAVDLLLRVENELPDVQFQDLLDGGSTRILQVRILVSFVAPRVLSYVLNGFRHVFDVPVQLINRALT